MTEKLSVAVLRAVVASLIALHIGAVPAAGNNSRAEYDLYPGNEAILATENVKTNGHDYIANITNPSAVVFQDSACIHTADPWVIRAPGGYYWLYYICGKSDSDYLGVAWATNINGPYTVVSNTLAPGYERPSGFNRPGWTSGPGYQEVYLTKGAPLGQNYHLTFYFSSPTFISGAVRGATGSWPSNSGWGTVAYDTANPGTAYVFAGNNWAGYGPELPGGVGACSGSANPVANGYWKVFRGYLNGNYDFTSAVDTGITSQLMGASWVVASGGEAWSATFHGARDERYSPGWQAEYWDMVGVANLSCANNRYWLVGQ